MSAPFDGGRDSSAASGDGFADFGRVADEHAGAFRDAVNPTTDELGEQDYRDGAVGAEPAPSDSGYTYPTARPGGMLGF